MKVRLLVEPRDLRAPDEEKLMSRIERYLSTISMAGITVRVVSVPALDFQSETSKSVESLAEFIRLHKDEIRKIDFAEVNLNDCDPKDLAVLFSAIGALPNLEFIDLANNELCSISFDFSVPLMECPKLRELKITASLLTEDSAKKAAVLSGFLAIKHLAQLDLSYCELFSLEAPDMLTVCTSLKSGAHLRSLDFYNNSLGDLSPEAFSVLAQTLLDLPLTKLNLSWNSFFNTDEQKSLIPKNIAAEFFLNLSEKTGLESLDLCCTGLAGWGDENLTSFLKKLQTSSLTQLDISSNDLKPGAWVEALVELISKTGFSALKIESNPLGDEHLGRIIHAVRANPSIIQFKAYATGQSNDEALNAITALVKTRSLAAAAGAHSIFVAAAPHPPKTKDLESIETRVPLPTWIFHS